MWPIKPWVLVIGNVPLGESASDLSLSLVLLVPDLMLTSFTDLSVMRSSRSLDGGMGGGGGIKVQDKYVATSTCMFKYNIM